MLYLFSLFQKIQENIKKKSYEKSILLFVIGFIFPLTIIPIIIHSFVNGLYLVTIMTSTVLIITIYVVHKLFK